MLQKFMLSAKPWQQFLIKFLAFTMVCVFTLLFFLCIAALGITRIDTPEYVLIPITTILLTASSFLDSFLLGKIFREKGIVIGFIVGLIFCLLIILLSIHYNTLAFSEIFITKISAVLLAGVCGGILGVN